MKRLLSLLLAAATLFLLAVPAMASTESTDATGSYVTLSVSGSGYATIWFECQQKSDVTRIHGSIYLEKKTASGWVNVYPNGASMDWQYDAAGNSLSGTCYYQISTHGEYRASAVYSVHYAGGGLDIISAYSSTSTY